nr:hypothetical protein [uncultured Desulfobacter sp.]
MPNDIILAIPLILRVSAPLQNNQRVIQYNIAVFLEIGDMDLWYLQCMVQQKH